jgi:hypothetical protein
MCQIRDCLRDGAGQPEPERLLIYELLGIRDGNGSNLEATDPLPPFEHLFEGKTVGIVHTKRHFERRNRDHETHPPI